MKARPTARISKSTSKEILSCIHPETQAYRIAHYLLNNNQVATGVLSAETSTANISDVVTKQLNPKLSHWGLIIRCHLPEVRIRNRFMQASAQHYWGVYELKYQNEESMAG